MPNKIFLVDQEAHWFVGESWYSISRMSWSRDGKFDTIDPLHSYRGQTDTKNFNKALQSSLN